MFRRYNPVVGPPFSLGLRALCFYFFCPSSFPSISPGVDNEQYTLPNTAKVIQPALDPTPDLIDERSLAWSDSWTFDSGELSPRMKRGRAST